jgi:hypothetical protein
VASSTLRTLIEGSAVFTQFDDYRASVSGSFSNNARFDYYCNLREGQDRFHAELPADSFASLTGAEVRIRCDGGPGLDLMSISDGGVAGPATVNGLVHGILRGGASLDTLSLDYLGVVGTGTVRARLSGGLQSDVVLLGLLAGGGSSNDLDVAVQGGRGNDTVFASVFDLGSASFGPLGGALADGGLDNGDACVVPGGTAAVRINCEK